MAKSPRTGPRPTKAERKEEARRQREDLQRRMARQRRTRGILIAIVAVVAAAALVVIFVVQPGRVDVPTPEALLAQQVSSSTGCGEIQNVGPYSPKELDGAHEGAQVAAIPSLANYPSVPPASGPHDPITQPAGVYSDPPPIDQVLHSLEHGAAVVWYDPATGGQEIERLTAFYRQGDSAVRSRVIVAPYDYPDQGGAGLLPSGTRMALVAWHYVQDCAEVSLPAAFQFTARYSAPPFGEEKYLGEAPEAGNQI